MPLFISNRFRDSHKIKISYHKIVHTALEFEALQQQREGLCPDSKFL